MLRRGADGDIASNKRKLREIVSMLLPKLSFRNILASTATRGNSASLSASLGVAILLASGAASAAGNTQTTVNNGPDVTGIQLAQRSNVRIPPEQPQEAEAPSEDVPETAESPRRFACEVMDGENIVMYRPEGQQGQSYEWAKPSTLGGGWTPERRCGEISRRLESYRPDGLDELRVGIENNYDVLCVTTQANSDCRIVLTVPPGQDPVAIRDRVFENLTVADSGQQTDAVNAIVDNGRGGNILGEIEDAIGVTLPTGSRNNSAIGRSGIDLRPFLHPSDGGTGLRLQGGLSPSSNRQLNPDSFR